MAELTAISPIDGRYSKETSVLSDYFSESALLRYRLMIEIEYLIALSHEPGVREVSRFTDHAKTQLRNWYKHFSPEDAQAIKKIEETTNHDVKAVEYFLQDKLSETPLSKYSSFIHFALTSEDVNNLSYSLMWQDALRHVVVPELDAVMSKLKRFAESYRSTPMLSLTHGQTATPTTVGKEMLVFVNRIERQLIQLKAHKLLGKLGGATGTWSAHMVAYPAVDWIGFSKRFISSLGLEPNLVTIQIESHDSLAESYHTLIRINSILIDYCRDTWSYISRGILAQRKKEGEIGSSTMPHKINPIQFENAEGNLGIANAYLSHLSQKLPISRMQRDLTDSTVLRNQGMPLAHILLSLKNIQKGLSRLTVNEAKLQEELDRNWEVLAEAIQTVLRKYGVENAYEKLKELTRGENVTPETLQHFIVTLKLPEHEKQQLLTLSPHTYTGLASHLFEL